MFMFSVARIMLTFGSLCSATILSIVVDIEKNMHGRLTFDLRNSASLSCHTFSGFSFTDTISTAYTRNTFFNTVFASLRLIVRQ